ncbi:MAG: maleylpyruvate isomerase family mycothiol-dependent enzyme, partial [Acidimicrobiia bacterium]
SGLPQMAPDALRSAVTQPFVLEVTGPGGGTWTLLPAAGDDQLVELSEAPTKAAAATATTTSVDFVLWATHRRPWRDLGVVVEGDQEYAGVVLDAIHVF